MGIKIKITLLTVLSILILSACGNKYEGDFSYKVHDFNFQDQNGENISNKDLDGKFWVTDFIYTSCLTVCPPMTSNMVQLHKLLQKNGLTDVQLVSFSIDPKVDTPKKLTDYVKSRGADTLDNWHLLTGYDFKTIKELSIKSFKAPLEKLADNPDIDSDQYLHSKSFYLVSPEGNAIKRYDGSVEANMKKIIKDIQSMN